MHSLVWTQPLLVSSSSASHVSRGHSSTSATPPKPCGDKHPRLQGYCTLSHASRVFSLRPSLVESIIHLLARGSTASITSPKSYEFSIMGAKLTMGLKTTSKEVYNGEVVLLDRLFHWKNIIDFLKRGRSVSFLTYQPLFQGKG